MSWLTILRKRDNFRSAFARFDIEAVAAFGAQDRERLMNDAGIVRNAAKIDATLRNARAIADLREWRGEGVFDALVWSHAPELRRERPASSTEVPAVTDESKALAKRLKGLGLAFVGPTTAYAAMQAMGLVDDHIVGCHRAS